MKKITYKQIIFLLATLIILALVEFSVIKNNYQKVNTKNPPLTLNIKYTNATYGFSLSLPESWKDYSVQTSTESAYLASSWPPSYNSDGTIKGSITAKIPVIDITSPHPALPKDNLVTKRDLPIEVFTLKQWSDLNTDNGIYVPDMFSSPIERNELGRNDKYVFAQSSRVSFCHDDYIGECSHILATFQAFNK